ncbi:MAG: hypothetical protein WBD20_12680 [Pirellulaceae bacterium]
MLDHGRKQFQKMIEARPVLARYDRADALPQKQWAIRQFAGEGLGFVVFWSDRTPPKGIVAAHSVSKHVGHLHLATHWPDSKGLDERLWAAMTFEFFNLRNWAAWRRLDELALLGKLSRNEFVFGKFEREYDAYQHLQFHYAKNYLPWVSQVGNATNPWRWYTAPLWWTSAEEKFVLYEKGSLYPWRWYGARFMRVQEKWAKESEDSLGHSAAARFPAGSFRLPPLDQDSQRSIDLDDGLVRQVRDGIAAIQSGDNMAGRDLLRRAIRSSRRHPGNMLPTLFSVSQSAKTDAHHQVDRMVLDRPVLNCLMRQEFSQLSDWVDRHFSGELLGYPVAWDGEPPLGHRPSSHVLHGSGGKAMIRLASRRNEQNVDEMDGFEKAWADLVFELHLMRSAARIARLEELAFSGEISRNEFVREMFDIQYMSAQRTQRYYVEEYLAFMEQSGRKSDPSHWYVQPLWWGNSSDVLKLYPSDAEYPWGIYGRRYAELQRKWEQNP